MLIIDQVPRDRAPSGQLDGGHSGLGPWPPTASGETHLGPGEERILALGEAQRSPMPPPLLPKPRIMGGAERAQPTVAGSLVVVTLQKDRAGQGQHLYPKKKGDGGWREYPGRQV